MDKLRARRGADPVARRPMTAGGLGRLVEECRVAWAPLVFTHVHLPAKVIVAGIPTTASTFRIIVLLRISYGPRDV